MNPFTFAVLAAASLFVAQRSHAADLPVKYDHVEYKQTGNTYKWQPLHGATPGGNGITFRGPTGIDTVQPKINTLERLPYDKRGTVPPSQMAKVASPFTKKAFGSALMLAGRVAWPVGVLMTAGEIVQYMLTLGVYDVQNDGTQIVAKKSGTEFLWTSPHGVPGFQSALQACYHSFPASIFPDLIATPYASNTSADCSSVKAGGNLGAVHSEQIGGLQKDINQQELEDLIAQQSGWSSAAARALQSALNTPGVTIQTEPPAVTGPSSIPGSTTTTTTQTQVAPGTTTPVAPGTPGAQPATSTTTTTTTTNNKYEGSSVTNNTTTTTVTNITNNVTNQTTKDTPDEKKEEETKEDDNEDETPTNKDLGDIPELYERKYPDGLSGIWNTKSAEIKQTPLFTLPTLLMPTGLSAGTCPSWQIDLSFGGAWGDYGSQDVSPPCWIWDIARVIIIASALILARALVFGG